MYRNIKKISFNYQRCSKFLSFSVKEKNKLLVKGFFGDVYFLIPKNYFIYVNADSGLLYIYFNSTILEKSFSKLKYIFNSIIFLSYGVLFYHMVNVSIKGIGYRFVLDNDNTIKIYSGNSLPKILNIKDNLRILDNKNSNNYSLLCCDYNYLNFFVKKLYNISPPNKYKEMGVFFEKKL